jgi:serine/threonine protein kinase
LPLPATVPPACLPQAQELRDFLLPMLDFDPARRATAAEMLAHPWLQQDLPPQQRAAPASQRQRGAGSQPGGPERVRWGSTRRSATPSPPSRP